MTLDILIFLIIITYFVKADQYELADYMRKHEIVNKIKSKITRAFIKIIKMCRLMSHIILTHFI